MQTNGDAFAKTLLLLLLLSFLELPNLFSAEAKNLTISNGVFSVDLIHRHSPLSPYYNSSMTRQERLKRAPLGSISHGHKIQLSSKYYNQIDVNYKSLELIPDGGEYLVKFSLGSPQVEILAIADTGSSLIWVRCSPSVYISQNPPPFQPTKSSTFRIIPSVPKPISYADVRTSCLLDRKPKIMSLPWLYHEQYADGTQSIGMYATETIGFPSLDTRTTSTSLPCSVFGCALIQSGTLSIHGEGIVGLGTGPLSLISQLGPKVGYKFSYCLTPLFSGVTSKLNFGANVTGPGVVSTPFTTGNRSMRHYYLKLNGITVGLNDNPVRVPVRLDVVIDSGSTLTYLPRSVFDRIKAALASAIRLRPVRCPVNELELCYKTDLSDSRGKFNPPDVVFHFKGADVVLKSNNIFWEIDDNMIALAMTPAESPFIFGNIAQVNYHVGYDLQAKQVSFAPTDCANH